MGFVPMDKDPEEDLNDDQDEDCRANVLPSVIVYSGSKQSVSFLYATTHTMTPPITKLGLGNGKSDDDQQGTDETIHNAMCGEPPPVQAEPSCDPRDECSNR